MLNPETCQKARLSRDPRFDGKFFTAVKTTGIYCRTICPVSPPKEENVCYYATAIEAANAGFRPCLRCRPDSAPGSPAWKGVNTTLERAIKLVDEGALQTGDLPGLAERLGISDRYLRELFKKHLGTSPKTYAQYQQCLFAKQLLQQTKLPVTQVALASGFSSIRRFNDCFLSQLKLTPSKMRKSAEETANSLQLKLHYRPPYDWSQMSAFLMARAIPGLEWGSEHSYGRMFEWAGTRGCFTAEHISDAFRFDVTIEVDDVRHLKAIVNNIRRVLDLDVDMQAVEQDLARGCPENFTVKPGIRLPGIWSMFEAGIRAILGQQISVVAARNLVTILVSSLGQSSGGKYFFPTPDAIAESELDCLKIPGSRKQTLRNLARHYLDSDNPDEASAWLKLKGIGPWTVDYARLRGLSEPDIFLGGDLGVKKALAQSEQSLPQSDQVLKPEAVSPWRSYLTFQLWSLL
ncbi:AlkA N-terminal domain-containing protein [Thalassomonas haliotis]|uniref:DNA-3-methyladenine glycosylase II n=1 Tax=Thalassomonas haliotis TaxID=485448 RepID=A0ABY7VD15_9GAMM|nr:AlkA N-terminal domain-containing protein [Thalassomonas haliotis]WDE11555.1 DNA-3-methyladenine glycosylase 2 family protein [Thalassomonas haliotis]